MDGTRVSDFSIERILGTKVDFSPEGHLQGSYGPPAPLPVPLPVPVPGCLQCRGMSFGEAFYACGAGFHHATIYPNPGVYVTFSSQDSADAQQLAGFHGCNRFGVPAPPRQKARMRTVFTDGQTKRLETLFELTDYPTVEARAEVARSTGLSEEIVRVWFKNRRARRKRQRSGSKVRSPCPSSPSTGAEKKIFSSFL